ncbi:MAG: 50S ribosomal protein L17 [Candidatus Omnitrophica bacterium]|nr:50S ribosomal protein L17 [Candidatus Omnitrophota bacterium]MBU4303904.1 50S ribosomal protein L17 [Candidatus Omnitrophota bacterium]MBU4418727.1 50S ribosomal protein L17 [Candidatus Omnitrophota bacterium]MBU4468081.1 50S ribosomal protein L17 [Candidatus Omnitrophota bacterium]MCG2707856.1 50S ribosomal protein L17 [Candidatus Omnitrophota bacterium]
MRHAKKRLQLSRFTSWHDATIRSLARNMVICQSIKTTLTRAKASKQMIEKLITLGKKNTLFARRQAQKVLGEHKLVNLLFNEIAPRFAKRSSGFTRIIGLGKRRGDNAEMVIFELTELKIKEAKKSKPAKEAKPQAAVEDIETAEAKSLPEPKKESKVTLKDKPVDEKKPQKKFMGGLRTIFKKKSDSL